VLWLGEQVFRDGGRLCDPLTLIDAHQVESQDGGSIYWDLFEVQTPECWRTIGADNQNGGTTTAGRVGRGGGSTFFEIGHPLDSDDDLHDLSAALGERIVVHLLASAATRPPPAPPGRARAARLLESESFVFLGDFESGDLAGWSAGVPGPRGTADFTVHRGRGTADFTAPQGLVVATLPWL